MTARRQPDMEFADPVALQDYLRELLGVLEALTQDPGLSRIRQVSPRRHPAIAMYDDIQRALDAGQVPIDHEHQFSRTIARLMLDRRSWAVEVPISNAFNELDDAARAHITERATQARTFDDIGAELFYWGWLQAHGYDAYIQEISSLPDIKIKGPTPFWVEVKRISAESSVNRVRSVLTKANRQLRTADPARVGVLFLHLDRPEAVERIDDNIPTDIQERINEISRTLQSSICRSVGQVVVAWDDFDALQSGRDGSSLYVARRRSVILTHQKPRAASHFDGSRLHVGLTGIWRVEYPPIADLLVENTLGEMGIRTEMVRVSNLFKQQNESPLGVRAAHAVKALHAADSITFFKIYDVQFILATQRVTVGRKPYVLIVLGSRTTMDDPVSLDAAYRLYDTPDSLDGLSADPLRAFLTLLERFGGIVRIGDTAGRFIPQALVRLEPGTATPIITVDETQQVDFVPFMMKLDAGPPPHMQVAWAYALRSAEYRKQIDVD